MTILLIYIVVVSFLVALALVTAQTPYTQREREIDELIKKRDERWEALRLADRILRDEGHVAPRVVDIARLADELQGGSS